MAYKYGRFVWFEIVTPNPDDAKAFWSDVAGFGASTVEMGGPTPYLMLSTTTGTIGGVVTPRMEGVPPHITSYLSVEDVDAACRTVVAHGGKVLVPAADIPIGRYAVVQDPQGATFQLWHGADGDDNSATGVSWSELWAKDATGALGFYSEVFGLRTEVMSMPQGPYHLLKQGETSVAGAMNSPDPKVPPMWLAYIEVTDVDAVVAKAKKAGGAVHAEAMSVEGVGRFAIIADRQGVVAGVLQSAPRS